MKSGKILVYLPSPMGDAIMATAALAAIRETFADSRIYFCGNKTVCGVLSPSSFADEFITIKSKSPFVIAGKLKKYHFDTVILLKNSFASAMAVFFAGIKTRIGYAREGRGIFLTKKICPKKKSLSKYKPVSVINYYLKLAECAGAKIENRQMSLQIDTTDIETVTEQFGHLLKSDKPVAIIVPGGAFGPSKMWQPKKFAQVINFLVEKYSANVFVSVSPNKKEKKIANQICSQTDKAVVNLADYSLSLGRLKALYSFAAIVVSNDTGPRHIAVGLGKKIVTLFGPNNPEWTENNYTDEIKIVADVSCAPCDKPVCKEQKHYCMESITAEQVCGAVEKLLAGGENE